MPDSIKKILDLNYTELIWIKPDERFLFQNKLEVPLEGPFVKGFYAGKYPVTQELYEEVMKKNPSHFKGKHRPVEQVSWDEAQVFLKKLNDDTADHYKDNLQFHLPTEVMWEYCARNHAWETNGIVSTERNQYGDFSGSHVLEEVGWYDKNSHGQTQPVGLKEPNLLGLHDMSGNVWEWCADRYVEEIKEEFFEKIKEENVTDKITRVVRGGSWYGGVGDSRALFRYGGLPIVQNDGWGFRLFRY